MNIIRLFVGGLGRLVLAALFSVWSATAMAATDEEVIARFKAESDRIKVELAANTDDMGRTHALQQELKDLLEKTYKDVSEKTRPYLKVSWQVIDPVMTESMAYIQLVKKRTEDGVFDYASATTAEAVEARLKLLAEIEAANAELAKRVGNIEADIESSLKASGLGAREKASFLAGFRNGAGRNFPAMRAVRTLDSQAYAHARSVYALLKDNLGKWSVDEGQILFVDEAALRAFNELMEKITAVAERQQKAINRIAGVTETPAKS